HRCWSRIGPEAPDMHRPGDVLDLLLAQILKREVELVTHLIVHHPADANPARLGESFEARSDVDPVAVDVPLFDDDIAQIDADAKLDALICRDFVIALARGALDRHRTSHRFDDAGKFHQQSVAGGLDDAAFVLGYFRVDQLAPEYSEARQG